MRRVPPNGKHTGWAYCHVPSGSTEDMTDIIENQIERFAPGFKETIIARHTTTATAFETYNPNYIGGDVNGGMPTIELKHFLQDRHGEPIEPPTNVSTCVRRQHLLVVVFMEWCGHFAAVRLSSMIG